MKDVLEDLRSTAAVLSLILAIGTALACAPERADEGAAEEETAAGEMETAEMEPQEAASGMFAVTRVVQDVRRPESVDVGPDGRYYVSEIGEFGTDGDGRIRAFQPGTWESSVLAEGLDDPKGMDFDGETLYVTDQDRVVSVDMEGSTSVLAGSEAFPETPTFLNDLVVGPDGAIYVSESGGFEAVDGAVYRIDGTGNVETVVSHEDDPEIASPNGLTFTPEGDLLIVDLQTGKLLRFADGNLDVVAEGFGGGDGLEFGPDGALYVTDVGNGRVFRVRFGPDGTDVRQVAEVARAADLGLDSEQGTLLIPQLEQNTITVLEIG